MLPASKMVVLMMEIMIMLNGDLAAEKTSLVLPLART